MVDRIRAIILKDRKILLVNDGKLVDGRQIYWSPGGHQETGETHQDTLTRELKEELGLTLESMELIGSYNDPNFKGEEGTRYYYLCKVKGKPTPNSEITSYVWSNFEDFKNKYGQINKTLYPILEKLHNEEKL